MSIDFGTDIYEEPLVAKTLLPEDNAEVSLRPHTLAEYIGQTKAKENLSVFIEAARRRTRCRGPGPRQASCGSRAGRRALCRPRGITRTRPSSSSAVSMRSP